MHVLEIDGTAEVDEFLADLNDNALAPFISRFDKLNETAPFEFATNSFKKLTGVGDMYEIKTSTHRILGFRHGNILVMTNGFAKKTDETPPKQIKRCQKARKAFLEST